MVLQKSNASLRQQKSIRCQALLKKLDEKQVDMEMLKEQLKEKEKEIKLYQIKLKEFKKGENGISLTDKQFLELEVMTAENQSQNVFQRIAVAARGGTYGRNASFAHLGASVT